MVRCLVGFAFLALVGFGCSKHSPPAVVVPESSSDKPIVTAKAPTEVPDIIPRVWHSPRPASGARKFAPPFYYVDVVPDPLDKTKLERYFVAPSGYPNQVTDPALANTFVVCHRGDYSSEYGDEVLPGVAVSPRRIDGTRVELTACFIDKANPKRRRWVQGTSKAPPRIDLRNSKQPGASTTLDGVHSEEWVPSQELVVRSANNCVGSPTDPEFEPATAPNLPPLLAKRWRIESVPGDTFEVSPDGKLMFETYSTRRPLRAGSWDLGSGKYTPFQVEDGICSLGPTGPDQLLALVRRGPSLATQVLPDGTAETLFDRAHDEFRPAPRISDTIPRTPPLPNVLYSPRTGALAVVSTRRVEARGVMPPTRVSVQLWSIVNRELRPGKVLYDGYATPEVRLSANGECLFAVCQPQAGGTEVLAWSIPDGEERISFRDRYVIFGKPVMSADGKRLVIGRRSGTNCVIECRSTENGRVAAAFGDYVCEVREVVPHPVKPNLTMTKVVYKVPVIGVSDDGGIVVVELDGRIDVWSVAEKRVIRSMPTERDECRQLLIGPKGDMLFAVARFKNRAELEVLAWNLNTGAVID